MKITTLPRVALALSCALLAGSVSAADYAVDIKGMHAYVEFKVPHLGYSILSGRFNEFSGSFSWDKGKPEASHVSITIQTASLDSNHKKRDSHLTGRKYLNVKKHPTVKFVSTAYSGSASGGNLSGELTLNGVTQPITLAVSAIGEGKDPWGGYRAGFTGATTIESANFGYKGAHFPKKIEMELGIEGVRQ